MRPEFRAAEAVASPHRTRIVCGGLFSFSFFLAIREKWRSSSEVSDGLEAAWAYSIDPHHQGLMHGTEIELRSWPASLIPFDPISLFSVLFRRENSTSFSSFLPVSHRNK